MAPSWSELPSEGRLPSPVGVRDTPRTGQEEATGECPDAHLARLAEGAGRRGQTPEGGGALGGGASGVGGSQGDGA